MSSQPHPNESYQSYNNMFLNPPTEPSHPPPNPNIFFTSALAPGYPMITSPCLSQQDASSDLDACSNTPPPKNCPVREKQKENQLRLIHYKKIIAKGLLKKRWLLKNINRKVIPSPSPAYGLNPVQLIRFFDNWFPVDSSLLSTKKEKMRKFYPLASRVQDYKRVLEIRNCQEKGFFFLTLQNKWLPPDQFLKEMQNLQWYMNW